MAVDPNQAYPTQVPAWSVTRVEDVVSYISGKGAVRVRRVHFRLYTGDESYVDEQLAGYTADQAKADIDAHALQMVETLGLVADQTVPKGG